MSEIMTERCTTTRPQQKQATVEVRRCAVCGNMDLADAFDHYPLTLDNITHSLTMCKSNGACTYQVEQLAQRLEFRDIDTGVYRTQQ